MQDISKSEHLLTSLSYTVTEQPPYNALSSRTSSGAQCPRDLTVLIKTTVFSQTRVTETLDCFPKLISTLEKKKGVIICKNF